MKKEDPKILIVEDNHDLTELFRIAFEEQNFSVIIAENGMEGIVKTLEGKPDIILLDLMMPQVDGFEMLSALRKNSSLDTPIVINSNLSQEKDVQKALEMGADEYLRKSDYTPDEVVERVKTILAEKKAVAEHIQSGKVLHTYVLTPEEKFLRIFFPTEILERFTLTNVDNEAGNLLLSFEEKVRDPKLPGEYSGKKGELLENFSPQKIENFSLGQRAATLIFQRRSWKIEGENLIFLHSLENENGILLISAGIHIPHSA